MLRTIANRIYIAATETVLRIGAIADGDYLRRSGSSLVGDPGGGAPTSATYVTLTTDAGLGNERTLAVGTGLDLNDGGAGGAVTVSLDLSEVSAGGDLSGTMDAPTVAKINGVTVSGTPAAGQVLVATGASAAAWASLALAAAVSAPNVYLWPLSTGDATPADTVAVNVSIA